jgi:hypothetical protein
MKASALIIAAVTGASAAVTTTLPASAGVSSVPTAIPVPKGGKYDGGMKRFERNRKSTQADNNTTRFTDMISASSRHLSGPEGDW